MTDRPKITLAMAISVNGIVADKDDQVPWTEPIWTEYFKLAQESDGLVVGRTTLELMACTDEIDKLKSVKIAVLTRNIEAPKDNLSFFSSPQQIVDVFQKQGLSHIIVGGGPQTNSLFLKENLIDEIILDVFPILMPSTGKPLFNDLVDTLLPRKLKLTRSRDLGNGCFRFHYDLI